MMVKKTSSKSEQKIVPYTITAPSMEAAKREVALANSELRAENKSKKSRVEVKILVSTGKRLDNGLYQFDTKLKMKK